jgi:hypothetical protein
MGPTLDRDPAEIGFVYRAGAFEDLAAGFQPYGVNAAGKIVGVVHTPALRAAETSAHSRARRK